MLNIKIMFRLFILTFILAYSTVINSTVTYASIPVTIDSRIKTLIYSENEVFKLVVHFGYQSNIEFAKEEEIETISIGNGFSWKITPIGRRLFIKPLEGAVHTNMTVITNYRTYQFEIESKAPDDKIDEELVYVVRFYYPKDDKDLPKPTINTRRIAPEILPKVHRYNFDYTLTGSMDISPLKVFDDGISTYLKFKNNNSIIPHIFMLSDNGEESRLQYSTKGEYIVIKKVMPKIALKLQNEKTTIYNESLIRGKF